MQNQLVTRLSKIRKKSFNEFSHKFIKVIRVNGSTKNWPSKLTIKKPNK